MLRPRANPRSHHALLAERMKPRIPELSMKMLLVNAFLCILGVWFAFMDHCLIVSSGIPVSGRILVLLALQAIIGAWVVLVVNGAFPAATEALRDTAHFRFKLIVFGVPVLFLLASPTLLSESAYEARDSVVYRISADSPAGHALSCCWNPFFRRVVRPSSHAAP